MRSGTGRQTASGRDRPSEMVGRPRSGAADVASGAALNSTLALEARKQFSQFARFVLCEHARGDPNGLRCLQTEDRAGPDDPAGLHQASYHRLLVVDGNPDIDAVGAVRGDADIAQRLQDEVAALAIGAGGSFHDRLVITRSDRGEKRFLQHAADPSM